MEYIVNINTNFNSTKSQKPFLMCTERDVVTSSKYQPEGGFSVKCICNSFKGLQCSMQRSNNFLFQNCFHSNFAILLYVPYCGNWK